MLLIPGWQPTTPSLPTDLKDCLCCDLYIQISPQCCYHKKKQNTLNTGRQKEGSEHVHSVYSFLKIECSS